MTINAELTFDFRKGESHIDFVHLNTKHSGVKSLEEAYARTYSAEFEKFYLMMGDTPPESKPEPNKLTKKDLEGLDFLKWVCVDEKPEVENSNKFRLIRMDKKGEPFYVDIIVPNEIVEMNKNNSIEITFKEDVEPICNNVDGTIWRCPKCYNILANIPPCRDNYCSECGSKFKWK